VCRETVETMHCNKILDLLPRFIENDFSPEESDEVWSHLSECDACRHEYEAMNRLVDTLEGLPPIGVPSSFKEAVMKALPPKRGEGDGGS
jgi:anti-sigma factor RsiW